MVSGEVRPLIIFVLVGIGIVYVLPLAIYFGDVLLTMRRYISRDCGAANATGPHGHLFGWPFDGMVVGTMIYPAPWTNLGVEFFPDVCGVGRYRNDVFCTVSRIPENLPAGGILRGLYLVAIFCYDYLRWARGSFIRFSIPALPFVFYALIGWSPKNRQVALVFDRGCADAGRLLAVGVRNGLKR
jgi:hypothetical protein